MERLSPLAKAVKHCGSQAALAAKIGATQQLVSFWMTKSKIGVSAQYVLPIERATDGTVTRFELRPDLYPPTESAEPIQAAE
jgi:DNA-binding transcriptional regulator YdaS (Cro superfamily)